MRESGLESYDPGYRSPGYPWLHICGILIPVWLLFQMGILPILFGLGLLGLGSLWYLKYARSRVDRRGAILHVFERLGQGRHVGLDRELRGIMKEKGLRQEDPYDEVVARANVIDLENEVSFEDVTRQAASILSRQVGVGEDKLVEGFLEGTRVGATPVDRGVALPHMRLHELTFPMMIVVRSRAGIRIEVENPIDENYSPDELNHAIFFLVSPEANPAQHLRVLAQLASHIDETDFMSNWVAARNEQHLKEILLRDERYLTLALHREKKTGALIGLALKDVPLPEDCLVALIRRVDRSLVPHGNSVLQAGDRLTLIGDPEGIRKLYEEYVRSPDHQSDGEP
jgi:mannitol/fructose-specific phosphotransferase system IIA component (Ntr-type)